MGLKHEQALRGVATALSAYSYARESMTFSGLSAPIRAALEDIRSRLARLEVASHVLEAEQQLAQQLAEPAALVVVEDGDQAFLVGEVESGAAAPAPACPRASGRSTAAAARRSSA